MGVHRRCPRIGRIVRLSGGIEALTLATDALRLHTLPRRLGLGAQRRLLADEVFQHLPVAGHRVHRGLRPGLRLSCGRAEHA